MSAVHPLRAELEALAAAAPLYDPDAYADKISQDQKPESAAPEFAYNPLSPEEVLSMRTQPERVRGIFPGDGLATLVGASGSAKTFLAIHLGAALQRGIPWFSRKTIQSNVLYVYLESTKALKKRLRAWEKAYNRSFPAGMQFILGPFDLRNPEHIRALIRVAPKGGVIIIDTLNRASLGIDENSSKDMGIIIKGASEIQAATDALVILVAHTGKDQSKGIRGHSSLFAALDTVLVAERKESGSRSIRLEKSKEGKDNEKFNFKLTEVIIDYDADGEPITSCVVEQVEANTKEDKPLTDAQQYALDSLSKACEAEGQMGVHLDTWRAVFYAGHSGDNDETKKKAFQRARADLLTKNKISVNNDTYSGTSGTIAGQCPPCPPPDNPNGTSGTTPL